MAANTVQQIICYVGGTVGRFGGAPGTAIIETGEVEGNENGRTYLSGIKPLVDTSSVTVAVGTRSDQASAVTYTSEVTPTTRTGIADFRSDAKYHRVRLTITGTFTAALGIQPIFRTAGKA